MPTGVEEAGLVMAALPLLVCLIDQYCSGLSLIKKWIGYKHSLRRLGRVIKIQQRLYNNACFHLFKNVLGKHSPTPQELLEDPGGELWKDPEIAQKFRVALGDKDWELFEEIIKDIHTLLNGIKRELERELPREMQDVQQAIQNQPQAIQNQPQAIQNQLQAIQNQPQAAHNNPKPSPIRHHLTTLAARFRYTFTNDKEISVNELRDLITSFHQLATGVDVPLEQSEQLRRKVATEFKDVRRGAFNLFEAINQGFTCACLPRHKAVLSLKTAFEPLHIGLHGEGQLHQTEHYDILFRTESSWKATKIAPRSHQDAVTACSQINNVCVKLQQPGNNHHTSCLGYLATNTQAPNEQKCYCLDAATTTISDEQRSITSLYELLPPPAQNGPLATLSIFERQRLILALTLSTSLLGLYSTPWIQDMWTSKDILFLQPANANANTVDSEVVISPYFTQTLPHSEPGLPRPQTPPPMVRNTALYALGKVFIQLIEGQRLVSQETIDAMQTANPDGDPEQGPATKLEKTVLGKVGKTWALVIRRCLYCEFDVDTNMAKLDNDDFLSRVHSMVIGPLADALRGMGPALT